MRDFNQQQMGLALLLEMIRKMEVYGPWPPSNPHFPSFSHIFAIFAGEISLKSSSQDARPALSAKQRALQSLLEMKRSGELQLLAEAGDSPGVESGPSPAAMMMMMMMMIIIIIIIIVINYVGYTL